MEWWLEANDSGNEDYEPSYFALRYRERRGLLET